MTKRSPLRGIRKPFVLDDDDMIALDRLARPRLLTLQDYRTPQELSNTFWMILGHKHGFDFLTVVPDPEGADGGHILAVPIAEHEPPNPDEVRKMLADAGFSANDDEEQTDAEE